MKKKKRVSKKKVVKREPADIVEDLLGEMYDRLAAKMVIALYQEKSRLIKQLKNGN